MTAIILGDGGQRYYTDKRRVARETQVFLSFAIRNERVLDAELRRLYVFNR